MARAQIRIAGRSYDLLNYLRGGASMVQGDADRARRLMDDCIRYLSTDDGHGLGNTPEHALKALEHGVKEARRFARECRQARAHLYRNASKKNPPKHGLLRCAGCRGRDAFIRLGGRDYCPVCAGKIKPKRRR